MKKLRNMFVSAILLASFAACSPPLIESTPSPSASSSSGTISTNPSSTPTPSATPTPAPGELRYDIPITVSNAVECDPTSQPKTIYEIKSNGTLTYLTTESGVEVSREKKLSTTELTSLRTTLQEINIAKLAESDEAVKPGTPQTTDCRTIETFYINVNGKDKSFDRNGRQFIHTKEYFDAITKLKSKLDELKSDIQTEKYAYSFPLRITNSNECSASISDRVLYQLDADKTFTYIMSENDLSRVTARKLSDSEFNSVKDLLKTNDIATLAEADTRVPPGTPQTKECRTIESTEIFVNGTSETYDKNGRQFVHSNAYQNALTKIKDKLVELAMK